MSPRDVQTGRDASGIDEDRGLSRRSALKSGAFASGFVLTGGASVGRAVPRRAVASSQGGPPTPSNSEVEIIPSFVVDADGNPPPFDGSTKLYDARERNPVLRPDGRQVTWAEYSVVTGTCFASCVEQGTLTALRLDGLIPDGLYIIWNVTFDDPGYPGENSPYENIVGVNPIGPNDGRHNTFRVSSKGRGHVWAITPGGSTVRSAAEGTRTGKMGACALTDEFEWHVVGAYHIDDKTWGELPGPAGTEVEQFGFVFRSESS